MNGPRLDVEYGAFWGLEKIYYVATFYSSLSAVRPNAYERGLGYWAWRHRAEIGA